MIHFVNSNMLVLINRLVPVVATDSITRYIQWQNLHNILSSDFGSHNSHGEGITKVVWPSHKWFEYFFCWPTSVSVNIPVSMHCKVATNASFAHFWLLIVDPHACLQCTFFAVPQHMRGCYVSVTQWIWMKKCPYSNLWKIITLETYNYRNSTYHYFATFRDWNILLWWKCAMRLHVEWSILLQTNWSIEIWQPGTACEWCFVT